MEDITSFEELLPEKVREELEPNEIWTAKIFIQITTTWILDPLINEAVTVGKAGGSKYLSPSPRCAPTVPRVRWRATGRW